MAEHEIAHVAIAPPDTLEADLIKKVAAILDKDPYDTRLLLAGEIPKIIAHCQSMQTAQSTVRSLRELGLVAFACEDLELRKLPQSFRAHTVEFSEGEVLFRDKGRQTRGMRSGDVFLILKGSMQTSVEEEATKARMKFSLGATVLTGGIPIWRRVREKTKDLPLKTECFARLYGRESSEPSVEMFQYRINYSFLGVKMAPSSLTNFGTLVVKLREVFPQAVFDDRLTKSSRADVSSTRVRENLEINCKLIHLYHLAASDLSASG
jgi:rhodanese-related sulfurtransferase